MNVNREHIENKILNILTYIEEQTLAFPLKQNIKLFSVKELEQLLGFLETWNNQIIYKFIDEKYKEYLWIMEELKMIQISSKRNRKLQEEDKEREIENKEIENLINF